MSKAQISSPRADSGGDRTQLKRDVVLDVLSNERRRFVVHFLKRRSGEPVTTGDLAERVASWELGKPIRELDYKDRKRVKNALRQFHLPKMEEMGFVEYDDREGTVALSRAAREQAFYVDVLPKREIPWGLYYVGLSALSLVCLVCVFAGVPLISSVPPLALLAGFTATFALSSVGHFYDNYYRMRLGARETPPEVAES